MPVLRIHAPVLGRQERVVELPDGCSLSVGRDDTCDVILLEQAASRFHANVVRHGDEIRVTDCDSANGVWVGDERVVGSRVLHDGEIVRIGDTTLELVLDPHHQATLYRLPKEERPEIASPAKEERAEPTSSAEAPATVPPAPVEAPAAAAPPAPVEAAAAPPAPVEEPAAAPPASVEEPAAVPPALVAPHQRAPVPVASSPSAYSLGAEPTLAGQSGPKRFGNHDPSSSSTYSIGAGPTVAAESGPNLLGVHELSAPSVYSIGEAPTLAPRIEPSGGPIAPSGGPIASSSSVYSLGHEPAAAREPDAFGSLQPSSGSVYSLGHEPAAAREPDAFGSLQPSSGSVYSLGHEPAAAREPDAFGSLQPSSGSVYSLGHEPAAAREPGGFVPRRSSGSYSFGDAPMGEFRGPDLLPPAPSFDGVASSAELGTGPPRPAAVPPSPSPSPPRPAHVEPRPPAFVAPAPARSAASSWGEWSEPMPSEHRPRGRAAGPALWLGLGLFIGGIAAMVVAVLAGYDPSELVSSITAAIGGNGGVH